MNNISNIKVEVIFLVFALIFGLVFALINPPFAASDETYHFIKAYDISEGQLIPEHPVYVPKILVDIYQFIPYNLSTIENFRTYDYNSFNKPLNSNKTCIINGLPSYNYPPLPYLGTAFVIKIGEILNAPILLLLYFGRLINLLFYIVVVYFAIKIVPIGKYIFLLLALMPMSLYSASSVSADSLNLALSFFTIAIFLNLAFKDNKINKKDIALLAICVLALSLSKQLYALLGLLFFIIPNSKFNSIKVKLIYFLLMFLPSIFFVLLQYNTIIGFLNHFIGVTPVLSISNPLQPPINPFLFRLSNSILIGGNFYLTSFIGSFGWATNPLPLIIVYSYVILLILFSMIDLSMFKEKVPEKFKKIVISQKIVSLLIFFIGIIFIFFAASNWTINGIVPPYFIFGVRGRYFIPLAPLLFLTLQNKKIRNYFYRKSSNNIRTHLDFFIIIFMGIILIVSTYYLSIIGLSTYSNFHQIM